VAFKSSEVSFLAKPGFIEVKVFVTFPVVTFVVPPPPPAAEVTVVVVEEMVTETEAAFVLSPSWNVTVPEDEPAVIVHCSCLLPSTVIVAEV